MHEYNIIQYNIMQYNINTEDIAKELSFVERMDRDTEERASCPKPAQFTGTSKEKPCTVVGVWVGAEHLHPG